MRNINEFIDFSKPASELIDELKSNASILSSKFAWSEMRKHYEPKLHHILFDKEGRKDKTRSDGTIDKASRISIGLDKLVVNRMTEFMFSIPVKRTYFGSDDAPRRTDVIKALERIYKHARIDSENLKRGRSVFASCEALTLWYVVKKPNRLYGVPCSYKLSCKTISAMDGYTIYPLFDEYDDMMALSFEYEKIVKDTNVKYFETYTSNKHLKWVLGDKTIDLTNSWTLIVDEELKLMKIPAVYFRRDAPFYADVINFREEIEYTLSRNSDTISYNSSPILKVVGQLLGDTGEAKGEGRRIYNVDNGGDVNYVSWSQSTDASRFQIDTLLKFYFMLCQMPDVSFDNMKGLGSIGFDARQTILTDAHLKVGDEKGMFIECFEREFNIIKEFAKHMFSQWADIIDELECEHKITPFVQNDLKSDITMWSQACGNKAVVSQRQAIEELGLTDDPEVVLSEIREDEQASADAQQAQLNQLF